MSQDEAVIRQYIHGADDNKLVRFMVAKSAMEPLAVANRKACTHPLVISLWFALSCVAVQVLNWWPDPRVGILGYLRPLPAFAVLSLPIMFFIDWRQRPQFEKHSTNALKRPDIADVGDYYSRSPGSGLWIYDFGSQFVGLVAVDASSDALSDDVVASSSQVTRDVAGNAGSRRGSTAVIRHFYISEPFRAAGAQDDLIAFATKRVFEQVNTVERIRITPSPLLGYIDRSLRKAGFEVVERGERVGIFGWTTLVYELSREKWETLQTAGAQ